MGRAPRGILSPMPVRMPSKWLYPLIAVSLLAAAVAAAIFRSSSLEQQVSRVQQELEVIRGLPFKEPIAIRQLSAAEARVFTESEIAKMPKIEDYWAVTRMLGLYRGPDLAPPEKIYGDLAGLAAGAYDSYTDTIFQFEDMDEQLRQLLLVHELYHGLQDQHFDLRRYLMDKARKPGTNNDEILARSSVVEGEASYIDAIYLARVVNDAAPSREQLESIMADQADWTPEKWAETARNPELSENIRERLLRAIEIEKRLPRFMFETFIGAYTDGVAFIHAVHEKGWPEVEKLYREHPPESTEQILHPEKWFAREAPVAITWPAFDTDPLFTDWQLLDENVLGERLWRVLFREQGAEAEADVLAAGWGGDRYAVFRNRHDKTYLMLTFTSWDTPEDAAEFGAAYRRVLEAKARGAQAMVFAQGSDVLIVECPLEVSADAFMEFNKRAVLSRP
jgi:hypothetical protein